MLFRSDLIHTRPNRISTSFRFRQSLIAHALTHGNGYATLYGHLASFIVRNGQLVYRGQVIAYEGSTGNSTGPHLHFEIRYNGDYRNPCAWLGC